MKIDFRSLRLATVCLAAAFLGAPVRSSAADDQMSQRFQYGLSWKAASRYTLKGVLQGRFRQGMRDFYYAQADFGFEYRPSQRFRFPVAFRFQDKETAGDWQPKRYLLLDPTWRFLSVGAWDFDFRPRFQVASGNFSLDYIRPLLNVNYNFTFNGHHTRWWIYDDYYLQTDPALSDAYFNPNDFSTGLSWALSANTNIYVYYMLHSSRPKAAGYWTNIHQPCIALSTRL